MGSGSRIKWQLTSVSVNGEQIRHPDDQDFSTKFSTFIIRLRRLTVNYHFPTISLDLIMCVPDTDMTCVLCHVLPHNLSF